MSVLCGSLSIPLGDLLYGLCGDDLTDNWRSSAVCCEDTSRVYLVDNVLSLDELRDDRLRAVSVDLRATSESKCRAKCLSPRDAGQLVLLSIDPDLFRPRNGLRTGERDLERDGDFILGKSTNLSLDLDFPLDLLEERLRDKLGKFFSLDCDLR